MNKWKHSHPHHVYYWQWVRQPTPPMKMNKSVLTWMPSWFSHKLPQDHEWDTFVSWSRSLQLQAEDGQRYATPSWSLEIWCHPQFAPHLFQKYVPWSASCPNGLQAILWPAGPSWLTQMPHKTFSGWCAQLILKEEDICISNSSRTRI